MAHDIKEKAQDIAHTAKDKAQDLTHEFRDKSKDATDDLRDKAQEIKGELQESWNTSMGKSWSNKEHMEGPLARTIERQTAKLPSDLFLWAAIGSIATSLAFQMMDRKDDAIFVGQWAPTFLILGLYNKIVKLQGHDAVTGHARS